MVVFSEKGFEPLWGGFAPPKPRCQRATCTRLLFSINSAWGKMLKIGTQGVGTGSDFFHQAPYIKRYLSVLSLLFQGMVGGQHRTSPFAGELLAVSFVAENG